MVGTPERKKERTKPEEEYGKYRIVGRGIRFHNIIASLHFFTWMHFIMCICVLHLFASFMMFGRTSKRTKRKKKFKTEIGKKDFSSSFQVFLDLFWCICIHVHIWLLSSSCQYIKHKLSSRTFRLSYASKR